MGWPPTKRGWPIELTIPSLTLATSVTNWARCPGGARAEGPVVLVLLGQHNFGHLGHRAGRHGYERGGGGRVIPDPVDGAQFEGAPGFGGVLVDATDQPAEPAQRHPDRTTNQPGAYNGGPAHPAGRQRRVRSFFRAG